MNTNMLNNLQYVELYCVGYIALICYTFYINFNLSIIMIGCVILGILLGGCLFKRYLGLLVMIEEFEQTYGYKPQIDD